jgi:caa(3)-type oxidase subunit IV
MVANENLNPISMSSYIKVFVLLIVLTSLTIIQPLVMHMELASTLYIQMGIAFIKIVLIVSYYMHIKGSHPFYKILVIGTTALLLSMYAIMAIDSYVRVTNNDIFN